MHTDIHIYCSNSGVHAYMHIYTHICLHVYIYTHIHIFTATYIYLHVYIYTHIHISTAWSLQLNDPLFQVFRELYDFLKQHDKCVRERQREKVCVCVCVTRMFLLRVSIISFVCFVAIIQPILGLFAAARQVSVRESERMCVRERESERKRDRKRECVCVTSIFFSRV